MVDTIKIFPDEENDKMINFFARAYNAYQQGGKFKVIDGKIVFIDPKGAIDKGDEFVKKAKEVGLNS